MISLKTDKEIKSMRKAGEIAKEVKLQLVRAAQPGITTSQLDQQAEKLIKQAGAQPSFKGYRGFRKSIVTCVNEEVVHGIPSARKLEIGDLLTLDLGVYYRGFHVDTALTLEVGEWKVGGGKEGEKQKVEKERFLKVGQQALSAAIAQCVEKKHVGDLSHAMQTAIESAGYNVVRSFVGHGVGKELHEEPQIPCYGKPGEGPRLKAGMVLAVEVMYLAGAPDMVTLADGWTVVSRDQSLSAMFEQTVAVGQKRPLILT